MAEQTPNILGNLQQKINDKSFNPQEYNREQLGLIDSLLEETHSKRVFNLFSDNETGRFIS